MTTNDDKIFNIVIGTAGHIDHGKSSMVQRLTGIDPDRLPEEKSRGLTIDLGFAPLTLKNGLRVGIVDVPGHERLIKNMVAGATGIDLVLLVIAADDGVMPQTREHLTIMQILGLSHGMVVITKIDAVEEEFLELVEEDVRETLEGTFLESSELVKVSSITGEGFEDLEKHLNTLVEKVRPREAGGIFRMPVQRVFSPKGFGTVVPSHSRVRTAVQWAASFQSCPTTTRTCAVARIANGCIALVLDRPATPVITSGTLSTTWPGRSGRLTRRQ